MTRERPGKDSDQSRRLVTRNRNRTSVGRIVLLQAYRHCLLVLQRISISISFVSGTTSSMTRDAYFSFFLPRQSKYILCTVISASFIRESIICRRVVQRSYIRCRDVIVGWIFNIARDMAIEIGISLITSPLTMRIVESTT